MFTLSSRLTRIWSFRVVTLLLLLAGLPRFAAAQEATLVGTVTDPSGAVIPNVTITITNTDTGLASEFKTNDAGQYVVPNLHIGHYVVHASAPGFKAAEEKDINLEVNDRRRVDFRLVVGAVQETVTVEAAPITVQAD